MPGCGEEQLRVAKDECSCGAVVCEWMSISIVTASEKDTRLVAAVSIGATGRTCALFRVKKESRQFARGRMEAGVFVRGEIRVWFRLCSEQASWGCSVVREADNA